MEKARKQYENSDDSEMSKLANKRRKVAKDIMKQVINKLIPEGCFKILK